LADLRFHQEVKELSFSDKVLYGIVDSLNELLVLTLVYDFVQVVVDVSDVLLV